MKAVSAWMFFLLTFSALTGEPAPIPAPEKTLSKFAHVDGHPEMEMVVIDEYIENLKTLQALKTPTPIQTKTLESYKARSHIRIVHNRTTELIELFTDPIVPSKVDRKKDVAKLQQTQSFLNEFLKLPLPPKVSAQQEQQLMEMLAACKSALEQGQYSDFVKKHMRYGGTNDNPVLDKKLSGWLAENKTQLLKLVNSLQNERQNWFFADDQAILYPNGTTVDTLKKDYSILTLWIEGKWVLLQNLNFPFGPFRKGTGVYRSSLR